MEALLAVINIFLQVNEILNHGLSHSIDFLHLVFIRIFFLLVRVIIPILDMRCWCSVYLELKYFI